MNKLFSFVFLRLVAGLFFFTSVSMAYVNEVWYANGSYRWRVNNVEVGQTGDLATAINNCIAQTSGVREVHVLVGGNLSSTIGMNPGLRLYCHNVSFTRSHGGTGFHHEGAGDIHVYDMNLTSGGGWGIHTSRASNLRFQNVNILSGGIGIRVDSHPSRPYEAGRWVYNLTVLNCRFENLGSHGLETYGVDGFTIDNIIARNLGECGVLINKGHNGTIGLVDAYRCSNGGGYAGLRFANDCLNVTVGRLVAVECGRGFFTVSTVKNVTLQDAYIRGSTSHAILLQNSDNVVVATGTFTGDGLNHYTSVNCQINAIPVGVRKIVNHGSGRSLEVQSAQNVDGANVQIWDYLSGANQRWDLVDLGNFRFNLRSAMSGGRALDASWSPVNGTSVYIWNFWNGTPQQWQIQPVGNSRFRINSNLNLAQSLDAYGTANGSNVGMWSYWGGNNQQWLIQNP